LPYLFPGDSCRLAGKHTAGPPLNLGAPGLLNLLRVVCGLFVEVRQQLRSDIGALGVGELQGFLQEGFACHRL